MSDDATPSVHTKMNPEAKAKWLEALRSGDYVQGRSRLQDENGCNCCLGVLARIQGVRVEATSYGNTFHFGADTVHGDFEYSSNYCPPDEFCDIGPTAQNTLIAMNDSQEKSFNEIADYIEANL